MASPRRRSARVGKRRLSDGGEDDVCAQERKGGEEGASPPVGRPRIDVATVFTASPAAPVSSTELQVATALVQEDAAPSSAAGHETASTLEARSGSATAAGPGPQPLDSAYDAPVSHVRVDAGLPTSCAGAGGEESAPIPSRNGKKARRKHKKKKGCVSEDKLKKVLGNYDRFPGLLPGSRASTATVPQYFADERVRAFQLRPEWFAGKSVLDVGCNAGYIAIACAELLSPASVEGIDIDSGLICKARRLHSDRHRSFASPPGTVVPPISSTMQCGHLPTGPVSSSPPVTFRCGDFCSEEVRVESTFDVVICLNVTMYVHLTRGDTGLHELFRRLHGCLKPSGKLILEYQPFRKYKKRRKLTEACAKHFASIRLQPSDFEQYLLKDVGFRRCTILDPVSLKLKRPLRAFTK